MSRDSSGNYSLPLPPVAPNTLIESTWANTTNDDMATAMTDSLSRSGLGGMLAPLKIADGVALNPAFTFTNEVNSGIYRAGSNDVRWSLGGIDIARMFDDGVGSRSITVESDLRVNGSNVSIDASGNVTLSGALRVGGAPSGSIFYVLSDGALANPVLEKIDEAAGGIAISFRRARGVVGAPTALLTGDVIGGLTGWGHDGTDYAVGHGQVVFVVDGSVATANVPTAVQFRTGSVGPRIRLNITSGGAFDYQTAVDTTSLVERLDGVTRREIRADGTFGWSDSSGVEILKLNPASTVRLEGGTPTLPFEFRHVSDDSYFQAWGGPGATSARVLLYGGNGPANKIQFRIGNTPKLQYQDTTDAWDFAADVNMGGNDISGVGALVVAGVTTLGNAQINGTLGVTGTSTLANAQVGGTLGVTGVSTLGTLICGPLTSSGIEDLAPGRRMQILDSSTILGIATLGYTLRSNSDQEFFILKGGNGADLVLYGSAHPTAANDILLRSAGNAIEARFDFSENEWDFQANDITTTGAITGGTISGAVAATTLSASGASTVAALTASGEIKGNAGMKGTVTGVGVTAGEGRFEVVSALPGTPDANTVYFVV